MQTDGAHQPQWQPETPPPPAWASHPLALPGAQGVAIPAVPGDTDRPHALCGSFLIWSPDAHPSWRHYWLSSVHLRPLPGDPTPLRALPGATHELALFAVDPGSPFEAVEILGGIAVAHAVALQPANLVAQYAALGDQAARDFTGQVARALVAGRIILEPVGILGARDFNRGTLEVLAIEHLDGEADAAETIMLVR